MEESRKQKGHSDENEDLTTGAGFEEGEREPQAEVHGQPQDTSKNRETDSLSPIDTKKGRHPTDTLSLA